MCGCGCELHRAGGLELLAALSCPPSSPGLAGGSEHAGRVHGHQGSPPRQPRCCGVALPRQRAWPPQGKLASGQAHECSNANVTGCQEWGPTGHLPSGKAQHALPCSILHPWGT